MRNSAVIISLGFECLYRKYKSFEREKQGEIPICYGRIPTGMSDLDGPLELSTEFAPHLVGEPVEEFGEDMLIENGPYEFVVEVGLLCAPPAPGPMVAVLDVEEAEVEGYEELDFVGSVGHTACGGTTGGETAELSGADMEKGDGWSPSGVETRDGVGHDLVDELLVDETVCYHIYFFTVQI